MRRFFILVLLLFGQFAIIAAQPHDACDERIEQRLLDYLGMDDIDELFDYLDSLDDDAIDDILDAAGIFEIEEACANGEYPDDNSPPDTSSSELPPRTVAVSIPTFEITAIPTDLPPIFSVFDKHIDVFGVFIVATADVPDAKIHHAAIVLAEYLDNDEDGTPDNPLVLETMHQHHAGLIMFSDEGSRAEDRFMESEEPEDMRLQLLYGWETIPQGSYRDNFDATIEEVLHLITTGGYAVAYPDVWGERRGSSLANAMDAALQVGHYNPFVNEADMPYPDQTSEYLYWALTSLLDAQNFAGRAEEIDSEWQLYTPELVQAGDPTIIALLTDPQYHFPTVLPDGVYRGVD